MKSVISSSIFRHWHTLAAATFVSVFQTLQAAPFTWNGLGADANWSTSANWSGTIPDNDGTAAITISGTAPASLTSIVDSAYNIKTLGFGSTAGAFTVQGSQLTVQGAAGVTHDSDILFSNASAATQTIKNNIVIEKGGGFSGKFIFDGTFNLTGTASQQGIRISGSTTSVVFNGVVSGASNVDAVAINSDGTAIFNAANTFTKSMTVWNGTIVAGVDSLSGQNGAFGNNASSINMGHGSSGGARILTRAATSGATITIGRSISVNTTSNANAVYTIGSDAAHITNYTGTITNGSAAGDAEAVTVTSAAGGRVNFTGNIVRNATALTTTTDHLIKTGAGIVTIGNTSNNWQGNTLVQQGTLLINGTVLTGTNNVQVSSSATLGGAGTINRNVTIAAAGILSAGDMTGTTSLGGKLAVGAGGGIGLSLANTSVLNFDLASASSTLDDEISVNGNLILDGVLNVNNLGGFGNGTYKLFDFSGTLTDNGLDLILGTKPLGFTYALQITSPTNGTINLLVTPEPGRALLLFAGLSAFFLRRRRTALFSR